jgi:tetratricopeptide (TPR) repeat protein
MSLLLEALKKAERAKEEAQRRARGEAEDAAPPANRGAAGAEPQPVLTRDQLPDIRQPLEILGDDIAPKASPPKHAEPTLAPAEEKTAPRARHEAQAAERAAARKVFEAKFKEPNPRLPFYITVGALGAFAVGTVIYFWLQLRPAPALVNANPPRPGSEAQVAAAETRPAPSVATPRAAAPSPAAAIPGLPSTAPAPAPAVANPAAQAPQPIARAPETPLLRPIPRQQLAPAPAPAEISPRRAAPQVHPKVDAGYAAYLAGDLAAARTEYQQALREEPANRDALLGLAALDVRAGRFEAAEGAYLRLLQSDPRDAHAQAALLALRGGRGDAVAVESRVKSMLADNPGAHVLNFTLGNQFAQQGRWAEAQQEYFKAFAAEPENADFAYNLAISLDQLRQPKLALEYYRRALALAKMRGASFDAAAAEARVSQLAR